MHGIEGADSIQNINFGYARHQCKNLNRKLQLNIYIQYNTNVNTIILLYDYQKITQILLMRK